MLLQGKTGHLHTLACYFAELELWKLSQHVVAFTLSRFVRGQEYTVFVEVLCTLKKL